MVCKFVLATAASEVPPLPTLEGVLFCPFGSNKSPGNLCHCYHSNVR